MFNEHKLKAKMIDAGYTRESFAKALNISLSTLNSRMKGYTFFNTDEIESICDLLKLDDPRDKLIIFFNEDGTKVRNGRRNVKQT